MRFPGGAERVFEMVRKEFRQLLRDPRMTRVILVTPVIQLLVFGYAVSTDIRMTSTFVVDHDGTGLSRDLLSALTSSGYFRIVGRSERSADLARALDHGDAIVGLEIPSDFAADLVAGRNASVQILVDGSNSNLATVSLGYAERIVRSFGAATAPGPPPPGIDLRERAWFNPALASQNYNVPAVIGTIMFLVCLLLTSLAVVREREIGTLEQLMVSPLQPGELIAGKAIPFALIGLLDLAIITVLALAWFGVPFKGSPLLLLLASLLYLASGLGIGLLISTLSRTQQEAFLASFLVYMPAVLLSGFMFPVSSMPRLFQVMTLANPVRHYLEIVRGLFLKGAGFSALWPQYLTLAVMGTAILALAASRFRKTGA
ncbi:MAG TPA: ABC transporter permease [Vicinamibacteria bacterium]|nr:ABC transporter permease [Vicinamibacteria bacterium]